MHRKPYYLLDNCFRRQKASSSPGPIVTVDYSQLVSANLRNTSSVNDK